MTKFFAAYAKGDRRLKILWIEDRPDDKITAESQLRSIFKRFAVTVCSSPEDAAELAMAKVEDFQYAKRDSDYSLTQAPYDIIIADCDLKQPAGGELPSDAACAEVAGLTSAVLVPVNYPRHPTNILPYSAYSTSFGNQYKLLNLFRHRDVYIQSMDKVTGSNSNVTELVKNAASDYRQALLESVNRGSVSVGLAERHRWAQMLGDPTRPIDASIENIVILTPWGRRPIGIDSLFHDSMHNEGTSVNLEDVRSWFDNIAGPSEEELKAQKIAFHYWDLSNSKESVYNYYVAMKDPDEPAPMNFPDKPPYSHPWLLAKGSPAKDLSVEGQRLALLFLLVIDAAHRVPTPLNPHVEEIARLLRGSREMVESQAEEILQQIEDEDELEALANEVRKLEPSLLSAPTPSKVDITRMLDPLPGEWLVDLSLGKDGKIYKAVLRTLEIDIHALMAGDATQIKPVERRILEQFAMEIVPTQDSWPAWLG